MAFVKGESGNPGGKSKTRPFADALRMELAAAGEDHKALRAVARALIASAQEGKMDAIRELADRTDGKVAQAIIGGDDDTPPIRVTRIELVAVIPDDGGTG